MGRTHTSGQIFDRPEGEGGREGREEERRKGEEGCRNGWSEGGANRGRNEEGERERKTAKGKKQGETREKESSVEDERGEVKRGSLD